MCLSVFFLSDAFVLLTAEINVVLITRSLHFEANFRRRNVKREGLEGRSVAPWRLQPAKPKAEEHA